MKGVKLINHIRVQRSIKDITQEALAEEIGVTRKTINTIENGKFVPSTILAMQLASYFGIKVEELFEIIENEY